jgi:hypothetical protein
MTGAACYRRSGFVGWSALPPPVSALAARRRPKQSKALAGRGNVAEALRAYERLRVLLREELGTAPSPAVQAVHRRLLL